MGSLGVAPAVSATTAGGAATVAGVAGVDGAVESGAGVSPVVNRLGVSCFGASEVPDRKANQAAIPATIVSIAAADFQFMRERPRGAATGRNVYSDSTIGDAAADSDAAGPDTIDSYSESRLIPEKLARNSLCESRLGSEAVARGVPEVVAE